MVELFVCVFVFVFVCLSLSVCVLCSKGYLLDAELERLSRCKSPVTVWSPVLSLQQNVNLYRECVLSLWLRKDISLPLSPLCLLRTSKYWVVGRNEW